MIDGRSTAAGGTISDFVSLFNSPNLLIVDCVEGRLP